MIIKLSILAYNEDLSIKCLDLIKELGLGVTIESSTDYNYNAIYRRFNYTDCDICVGIDEDCFISNPRAILDISKYMVTNWIPFIAMNELSGVSGHRKGVPNAIEADYNSFLMFTQPKLIGVLPDRETIVRECYPNKWIEPYWSIFRYLDRQGIEGRAFNGYTHEDKISTILTWEEKPFALHTWYARDYNRMKIDPGQLNHRQRINDRYGEIKDGLYGTN